MQLERARIKNLRALRDIEVSFGAHTALDPEGDREILFDLEEL